MNIIQKTKLNNEDIWKILRKIRSDATLDKECDLNHKTKYDAYAMQSMVDQFELQLKVNETNGRRVENISKTLLEQAGEMYLYISFCPDPLMPWLLFYKDLFEKQPANIILLTLNRILKGGNNNSRHEAFKIIAEKLLNNFRNILADTESLEGHSMTTESEYREHSPKDFSGFTHPVHMISKGGKISPSAFIPFCEFGGNVSTMELMSDQFDVPICNSFEPKILNDELCYEIDVNKYTSKDNTEKELKSGLIFIMDYNEDRQITLDQGDKKGVDKSLHGRIQKSEDTHNAIIYLETIGMHPSQVLTRLVFSFLFS